VANGSGGSGPKWLARPSPENVAEEFLVRAPRGRSFYPETGKKKAVIRTLTSVVILQVVDQHELR